MDNTATNTESPKTRRPLIFAAVGVFLLCVAGFLVYDRLQVHTVIAPTPQSYTYNVQQTERSKVYYQQSSFFSSSPDTSNTAYLADLTNKFDAQFHYSFRGSKATKLSYSYGAVATVRSTYGSESTDKGTASVWTKQFQLLRPVTGTQFAESLTFDPLVQVPFAEYKQEMEQFKSAFSAPLNGELVVTYSVRVSGSVNGTPFTDNKVSTITVPLNQPVYRLAVKFTKIDHQEVVPAQSKRLQDIITKYEMPVAIVLTIVGLACIIYGFRRQIFKTPYMRELEKIYRYHGGIIVRASRPISLANKNIVTVQSFDDLLNLEEEIKSPIIANPVSDNAAQFIITRDDIVYVYNLGDVPLASPLAPPKDNQAQQRRRPVPKSRVSG